MRSMVEGAHASASPPPGGAPHPPTPGAPRPHRPRRDPSTPAFGGGPPPRSGEE
jgi:hypothetical protein